VSRLAEFRENFGVEIGANPEPGNLDQFVENGFSQFDQPSPFCSGYDTEEACNGQACGGGSPTSTPFINEQEVRPTLDCKHDCLSFARIQILAKFLYTVLVRRSGDYSPWHRRKIDCGRQIAPGVRQFTVH
jgi:hypothetical protein